MSNAKLKAEGEARRATMVEFIRAYVAENGYAPSQLEIGAAVGVSAPSAIRHLRILEREGKVRMGPGPRMLSVIEPEPKKKKGAK